MFLVVFVLQISRQVSILFCHSFHFLKNNVALPRSRVGLLFLRKKQKRGKEKRYCFRTSSFFADAVGYNSLCFFSKLFANAVMLTLC